MTDLHDAIRVLANSLVEWTETGREILLDLLESASKAPQSVDSAALANIVGELADFIASKRDHAAYSVPAPEAVPGCSEVEWDRVGVGIDLGELGLRSKIFGTVWTASIAQTGSQLSRDRGQLWARLVDDASAVIHDEVEMRLVDGIWSARGYVPPSARKTTTRVDVTSDPAIPARTSHERSQALAEQSWFRLLHFERLGSTDSLSARWREVYRQRVCAGEPSWAGPWFRPFLAEHHLRPTDLASGRQTFVSPGSTDSAPSAK